MHTVMDTVGKDIVEKQQTYLEKYCGKLNQLEAGDTLLHEDRNADHLGA